MSAADRISRAVFALYMVVFFAYLFAPLAVMGAATFNTSRFPTVIPWQGTTLQWFAELWNDRAGGDWRTASAGRRSRSRERSRCGIRRERPWIRSTSG